MADEAVQMQAEPVEATSDKKLEAKQNQSGETIRKQEDTEVDKEDEGGTSTEGRVVRKYQQVLCAFCASLSMAACGHSYSLSSFLIPQLEHPDSSIRVTSEEGSWLASIMMFGCIVGSLVSGWLSDRFGRRWTLIIENIIYLLSFVLIAFAPNYIVMLVARLLSGYAAASTVVALPVYVSEISQPQIRGFLGGLTTAFYTTGFGVMGVLGAMFPWRIAIGLGMISPICALIGLKFYCCETPVWLLRRNREAEAVKSLTFLRNDEGIINEEMHRIKENLAALAKKKESLTWLQRAKELFQRPSFIKPFLLVCAMIIIGLELSGMPALAFYLVSILQDSNLSVDPYWASAFLTMYRSVVTILASGLVVNRLPRRPVFLSTGLLISVSASVFATYTFLQKRNMLEGMPWTSWIPLVAFVMIYTGFSTGYGPIIFMSLGEMLPADARSFGCGLVGFMDNIFLFIVAKMVPTLADIIGFEGLFWMFSLVTFCLMVVMYFTLPETKDMSLEEIEAMFGDKSSLKKQRKAREASKV